MPTYKNWNSGYISKQPNYPNRCTYTVRHLTKLHAGKILEITSLMENNIILIAAWQKKSTLHTYTKWSTKKARCSNFIRIVISMQRLVVTGSGSRTIRELCKRNLGWIFQLKSLHNSKTSPVWTREKESFKKKILEAARNHNSPSRYLEVKKNFSTNQIDVFERDQTRKGKLRRVH